MQCTHCLKETNITRDHVFPKSWYPDNTPEEVQRPIAPSCSDCNNRLSSCEEKLGIKLAFCIDSEKAEISGIHRKVYRSLGIGINTKLIKPQELKRRMNLRKKLIESLSPYEPGSGYFPGLGPKNGYPHDQLKMIPVPEKELLAVSEKIIRGLEYHYDNRLVEAPFELDVYFSKEGSDLSDVKLLLSVNAPITYGPGFKVERTYTQNIPRSVIYKITIWGTLEIHGTIMKVEDKPK